MALTALQGDVVSGLAVQSVTAADLALSNASAGQSQLATTLATVINSGSAVPNGVGFTPVQIRTAYGLNALPTDAEGAALDGTGQTIAIIDAYDDPNILTDVNGFDQQFGATSTGPTLYQQYGAAASFLTVLNQNGKAAPLPATDPAGAGNPMGTWELEESLDVEWLHVIAPGAKIVLVEANTTAWSDLTSAELSASQVAGVSVVSMSWGISDTGSGTSGQEGSFNEQLAAISGVSYVAATGDQGGPALYPAASPDVLAVGGTSLKINTDNSYQSESAWSDTGGGFSQLESKPAYQDDVLPSSQTQRSVPDVAFDGNPNTGVVVYDSYDNTATTPWSEEGGTSLGTPVWAGLVALADQGRQAAGSSTFNAASSTELSTAIYSLPQQDFHDITTGANKNFSATAGFDQVTGLGTPVVNLLVPDLIAYGNAVSLTPGSLATGTVGLAYSQSITASGGIGPKTMNYSITSGTLPTGLAFAVSNSELDIVGTPLAAGNVTFDVSADDTQGQAVEQSYTLSIGLPAPSVSSIVPAAGPSAGGTTVTISGTNLGGATAVMFGTAAATIVSDSSNQIVVTSPPGLPGILNVTVTTAQGTSALTSADQFTYVSAPTVTGVNPPSQQTAGGLVTIAGSNLLNATAVDFGNVPATIVNDTQGQIVVIGPSVIGTVNVTVTTAGGTSAVTSADQFTSLVPAPTVAIGQTPPAISNQSAATFTFSGTGDAGTPTDQLVFEISLDGSAFAPASSPATYSGLADGSHTFQVEAIDLAGTASAPASYTWLIDTAQPVSRVGALPYATSLTSFSVSWSGSDGGQGSGIASYSIYVSTDGGAFTPWLTDTVQTSATFSAQIGHTYGFYSTAEDIAGNIETAHSTADATITTTLTPWKNPANPLDVNGNGAVSPLDALIVINYLNTYGVGVLPATNPTSSMFLDVDGDNSVSPLDVLWVINYLNSQIAVPASDSIAGGGPQSLVSSQLQTAGAAAPGPPQQAPSQTLAASDQVASQTSGLAATGPSAVDPLPTAANSSSSAAVAAVSATASSVSAASSAIEVSAQASASSQPFAAAPASAFTTPNQAADSGARPPAVAGNSANPTGLSASGRIFSSAALERQPALAAAASRSLVLAAVDAALSGFGEDDLA